MPQQGELQDYINVKLPSRIKSINFIPWKSWKRQWVVVRRSRLTRNGVELLIGKNSQTVLQISVDDIICRTESRTQYYAFGVFPRQSKRRASIYLSGTSETDSQKWISTIRKLLKPPFLPVEENEFSVSVIDNFFTRSSGLSGLYGTLRVTPEQVTVVDPFTSKNKAQWPWMSLAEFHVSSTIAAEDKGHICTIITSRSFPSGVGPIHLFCLDGVALTRKLKWRGRAASLVSSPREGFPYRHHTFSGNPGKTQGKTAALSKTLLSARRLSRSEGNLLLALRQLDSSLYDFLDQEIKVPLDTCESLSNKRKVVVPGIISAGLGLILSTPGGSEGEGESLHEYQSVFNCDSDEELTSLSFTMTSNKFSPPRRESGVSVGSGLYEEIDDLSINLDFSSLDITSAYEVEFPPPLPPRREVSSKTLIRGDEGEEEADNKGYTKMLQVPVVLNRFLSRSAESSPAPSLPCLSHSQTLPCQKSSSWSGADDCDYLPMLPGCGFLGNNAKKCFESSEALEDQHYMVMASIKGS